jgi:hypothetical protein
MKANQEKIVARMEANQEKLEAVVEHYKLPLCIKAMHLPTTLQGWASDIPHGVHEGAIYEETAGALEDQFGDQHLVAAYHSQLKTRTQLTGVPL